jgi:alanine racemase
MQTDNPLIWVEISQTALQKNIKTLRNLIGDNIVFMSMVKANAYGHGLIETGKIFRKAGSEYLAVNSIFEARKFCEAGDKGKIYIAGYTSKADLAEAVELDCELVVYNLEILETLSKLKKTAKIHLKVETGTHRQGIMRQDLPIYLEQIKKAQNIKLIGVAMHFANIEDTTNHNFAKQQLVEFNSIRKEINNAGFQNIQYHAANSAATLLWDITHFDIVRVGISAYGMWPSEETFLSLASERKEKIILYPALTWKTRIVQIKNISIGAKVGYGCTWEASKDTRIAILPVGYYDGYARKYTSAEKAEVLIRSKRAKVIGRVCMNMFMVDISNIPEAKLEDEVVLLGKMGDEEITAEEMGEWGETINYEVVTRIRENISRKVVE